MKWIRSPSWDLCWIWSGFPIGGLLVIFYLTSASQALLYCFAAAIVIETAHTISPIVLSWSHPSLRAFMWRNWHKSVALAGLAFGVAIGVGAITQLGLTSYRPGPHRIFYITSLSNPLPILVSVYYCWNIYHFGMQNFGVARLYKGMTGSRLWDMLILVGLTAFLYAALPRLYDGVWVFFLMIGVISLNHWLVEIGLCGRVSGHPGIFVLVVLLLGACGFLWLVPTPNGNLMHVVPIIISARVGLSFVHFLYDRWIWRMSDPEIRAIIAPALAA